MEICNTTANLLTNTNIFIHTSDSVTINKYFKNIFTPMPSKIEKDIHIHCEKSTFLFAKFSSTLSYMH